MELTSIPGVGEKTAEALDTLAEPRRAIEEGDVATLANAPGVTPGRAARIVRGAIQAEHGDDGEFLATDRARDIYDELLGLLQDRARTDYARRRLETIYPTSTPERIDEVRELTEAALERDPEEAMAEPLSDVRPLSAPTDLRIRDRCLATGDAERYESASEAVPELSVEIVDNAREIADLAAGYGEVVVLDAAYAGLDLDDNVSVRPDALEDPATLVPERTIAYFATNREAIEAAIEVHRRADRDPPTDLDRLEDHLSHVRSDGTVVGDEEQQRLRTALDDFEVSVELATTVANDALKEAITDRDVTVEGTDLLSLVERGAGVDTLLTRELTDEYATAIEDATDHLIDALALTEGETTHVERLFPREPTFPVAAREEATERLREDLQVAHDRRARSVTREIAADLADERSAVETLVANALELDLQLAIARFARDFDCTMPTFDGSGFDIEGGRSPLLDVPVADVEPIAYAVDDVTLLSGVNSGGKTSLLDLVAAVAILAHMGLPVPAERVRLQRFDALHYHAATQGTLDAGAFEATVRQFAELATAPGNRLVLVDELESITEPGAAAVIVGGILEEMADEVTGVFVSHLASEIRAVSGVDIRVDGIAASGVEDGELVVDRTPVRDHLARSTPELIVEQLAERHDGPEAAVYDRLLEKFD